MTGGLGSHLWQSTWVAGAAALLALVLRGNRARVRYWIWLCASVKFLVPFAVLIGVGGRLATPVRAPIVVERVAVMVAEPPTVVDVVVPVVHKDVVDWRPFAAGGLWACGVAAILFVRLRAWTKVRAALRASRPVGINVGVEVRSAPGLLEPGVVGLLRPVLLLPEGIVERLSAPQLESVLAHELCHVRRRDNLLSALHMVVEAVFWFHPVVWWIGARLVEERERACDEGVLSLGGEPRTYAEAILGVCKLYVESPLVCVSGVTGADLKKRIEAIMSNRVGLGLNFAKKVLLTSAGAAALVGPVAIGLAIGTAHLPVLHAQVAVPQAPRPVATQQRATPAPTPAPADRRLLTLLFDCGAMNSDEQQRARQAAIEFVRTKLQPNDVISVMQASSGKLMVVLDYSNNSAVLESAIASVGAQGESSLDSRLATLEQAARILGAMPGKKALIYFSPGTVTNVPEYQDQLKRAVQAAVDANVAFYAIDVRGLVADVPRAAPQDQRKEEARARFGDTSSAISRTYIRYGQPDQIEDGGTTQIWRYNYLPTFRGRAEFEFQSGNRISGVKVLWPPPTATFEGVATDGAGFASRHATIETYPAGEMQTITAPLDDMAGKIDIAIDVRGSRDGSDLQVVANARDSVNIAVPKPTGMYQARFLLEAGSYEAKVLVREQATGKVYTETIRFQVM